MGSRLAFVGQGNYVLEITKLGHVGAVDHRSGTAMPRGRPLSFDRAQALQTAMHVFWTKGYEGTQVIDLTAAMGINPPSFYACFKGKRELFAEAVDLYIEEVGSRSMTALQKGRTLKSGLRAMLESVIDIALSSKSGGCLMVLGVVDQTKDNREAYDYLRNARKEMLGIIQKRISRAVAEGELLPRTKVKDLSLHFLGITQTISFQARDGACRQTLRRLIAPALAALPMAG